MAWNPADNCAMFLGHRARALQPNCRSASITLFAVSLRRRTVDVGKGLCRMACIESDITP